MDSEVIDSGKDFCNVHTHEGGISSQASMMHDTALSLMTDFLKKHNISCALNGEKQHRTRMLVFNIRGIEYIVVFEQAELPDLNVNYVGSEGQFINERFTLKSFPDLQARLAEAMASLSDGNSPRKRLEPLRDEFMQRFSVELIETYCRILANRLQLDV